MAQHIPCFVINLESDTHRCSTMQQRLAQCGVSAEFIKAVDGRTMSTHELERHVNRKLAQQEYGHLSPAEIGTALSHLSIYQHMVENKLPGAVILEDDVCLANDFAELLSTTQPCGLATHFRADQPVMVQLTHVKRGYRHRAKMLGAKKARPAYGSVWLASGYFITLAAAKNLSQALYPVWTVADHWNRFSRKRLVKLWALSPNAVWEAEEAQQSNLSPQRVRRKIHRKTIIQRLNTLRREIVVKPLLTKRLRNVGS